jgi:hypothetical protein
MNGITTAVDLQTSACSLHGHFSRANFDLTDSKDSVFYRTKVKTSSLATIGRLVHSSSRAHCDSKR